MSTSREPQHQPVLPAETLQYLAPRPGTVWVDCTVGGGGHAKLIAEAIGPTGRLIGLDQDATMLDLARPRLPDHATLVTANFDQVDEVLNGLGIGQVDGVLADLGVASDQLDDPTRGLSLQRDGPLDMRLDGKGHQTAANIVNRWSQNDLADLIYTCGEERYSRRIARRIVERRGVRPFESTLDLAEEIRRCVPHTPDSRRIHPATRTFQALRIGVNDELAVLERLLSVLPRIVRPGGRAGIISFHSLEDRRVKQAFRNREFWVMITKKPVEAGAMETAANPRARSAKLRVAERIE